MVARVADPWSGRVLVDEHDVRHAALRRLREQVSNGGQEPLLLHITIAENIAYGKPDATDDEVTRAAKAACAHEFIERLPDGYDTVVGERGATLSSGEKQRISIARALLKDAPILILDEPTSALDAATEMDLIHAMSSLITGKTTFLIAHRLSTARWADRIVVMDKGRIVEAGTHAELLAGNGAYAALYSATSDNAHSRPATKPRPVTPGPVVPVT
jgi:ATP-binding cassette subfamily B protein/subfamily B ATP-binding cassette protein MsbA